MRETVVCPQFYYGRNFVMCITGLSDEHAKGLTAMYDLAFVNERELAAHLSRLF